MKYSVVRNRFLRGYLFLKDVLYFFCKNIFRVENKDFDGLSLGDKRILLRNPAAFGDVLYTLRLVAALKKKYPNIEVGLLVGRWVKSLVELSPDITYVHYEDHWAVSRSKDHILLRYLHWWKDRLHVAKEIREKHYDIAVDLYYYFPSGKFLFYQVGIPCRVGYDSNGGASLLTKIVSWSIMEQHNVEYQAVLLREIGFLIENLEYSFINVPLLQEDRDLLSKKGLLPHDYIIVHIGAGKVTHEWSTKNWESLIRYLEKKGYKVFLTGIGEREKDSIDAIVKQTSIKAISLCNQLTLQELFRVINCAYLFIGVDSFAGHIAAMYKIPQISIMHGAANQYHWKPYHNENCVVVQKKMACSPCYFPSQCKLNHSCMDIPAEDVIEAIQQILGNAL